MHGLYIKFPLFEQAELKFSCIYNIQPKLFDQLPGPHLSRSSSPHFLPFPLGCSLSPRFPFCLPPLSSRPAAMAKSWIITGRGIATKIRNATDLLTCRLGELVAEAWRECPNCKYRIDNSDVSLQWPGLPAGVMFAPSDLELLKHLEGKVSPGNSESHILINDFIPTLEEAEGICYTHPENLPGVKMDGSSSHFFHRIANAYGCGQRKRRRISNNDRTICDKHIRWHKTGKSKTILDNGVKKGWKKILVLYAGSKREGDKIEKDNWVMHQYHLGVEEDEKDGELVVSKVFYQLTSKQIDKSEIDAVDGESDAFAVKIDPRTPKSNPPQPRRPNNSPCETEQNATILQDQEEGESGTSILHVKYEAECSAWYAMSQPVQDAALPDLDTPLQCNQVLDTGHEKPLPLDYPTMDALHGSFPDLDNLGTLADLQFGSQDSYGSWLHRI